MNEFIKTLLSLSVSGALLLLLLLLFKLFWKQRISKTWQYYIWLIVIARLLLPFGPQTNLVGSLFSEIENSVQQPAGHISSVEAGIASADYGQKELHNGSQTDSESGVYSDRAAGSRKDIPGTIVKYAWLVWLVAAVGLLIRKITVYQSFVKYINAGLTEVTDIEVWERIGILVEQAKVKAPVTICINSLVSTPMLVGFLKPVIMLPTADLPYTDFEFTILHELVHYRRRDMFYKWLVQIAVCIHWFNPLIYLMEKEIGRACELSCDEAVIRNLDEAEKRAYGDTLVNAVGLGGSFKNAAASITLFESQKLLKERLDAIMNFKVTSKAAALCSALLAGVLFCSASFMGVYAAPAGNSGSKTDAGMEGAVSNGPDSMEVNGPYLSVENCSVQYEDTAYKWPVVVHKVTNKSEKIISSYEIGILAFDKDGKPLELYWDAYNVAANGEVGSVGYGSGGIDYGWVTGIEPNSPKSYLFTDVKEIGYGTVDPGETTEKETGYHLFDGWWDQPDRIHKAEYLLSCVKQITFSDQTVWKNPEYKDWLKTYEGHQVVPEDLESYYKKTETK